MISFVALNRLLFQLDPHEERIQNGTFDLDYSDPKVGIRNNQGMLLLGAEPVFPFLASPNPNIKVIKTGRFFPVPTHVHNWVEVGYMYSGSCQHTIKDKTYTLSKGQLYILDSDTPHSIGYLGENDIHISLVFEKPYFTESFFTHFSRDSILSNFLINSISEHNSHDNFIRLNSQSNRRVHLYISEILCEHLNPSVNSFDIINNFISLLFLELVNIYESDQTEERILLPQKNIIPILKYIESNYKTCDLKSTAKFFNMNANYLTTLLRKYTGYSFKQLIQRQRFQTINSQLLNTTQSIESIAISAGYDNTTYFYKKYKEAHGCSPKEYRNKYSRISH